jgi:sugar/nucleoside kinase (ribokinase family)
VRLVSLGDLILDVIVGLDEPLVPGDDRIATTRVGAGGQAANVAAWAASLGAEARYVGKRGADSAGQLAAGELARHGVEISGPAAGRNGVVVSIACGGERSMASDRGSAIELEPDELEPGWFRCDRLHVSGYALLREPVAFAALRAVEFARAEGAEISVDLSASTLIDDTFRARVAACGPETIFATESERDAFGALDAAWVVKRGAAGVNVAGVSHPALPIEAIDPTGAGDAFAAGYLVGGVQLGLEAAARCCATLGAMPGEPSP